MCASCSNESVNNRKGAARGAPYGLPSNIRRRPLSGLRCRAQNEGGEVPRLRGTGVRHHDALGRPSCFVLRVVADTAVAALRITGGGEGGLRVPGIGRNTEEPVDEQARMLFNFTLELRDSVGIVSGVRELEQQAANRAHGAV
jgi:hypothetical protein